MTHESLDYSAYLMPMRGLAHMLAMPGFEVNPTTTRANTPTSQYALVCFNHRDIDGKLAEDVFNTLALEKNCWFLSGEGTTPEEAVIDAVQTAQVGSLAAKAAGHALNFTLFTQQA